MLSIFAIPLEIQQEDVVKELQMQYSLPSMNYNERPNVGEVATRRHDGVLGGSGGPPIINCSDELQGSSGAGLPSVGGA